MAFLVARKAHSSHTLLNIADARFTHLDDNNGESVAVCVRDGVLGDLFLTASILPSHVRIAVFLRLKREHPAHSQFLSLLGSRLSHPHTIDHQRAMSKPARNNRPQEEEEDELTNELMAHALRETGNGGTTTPAAAASKVSSKAPTKESKQSLQAKKTKAAAAAVEKPEEEEEEEEEEDQEEEPEEDEDAEAEEEGDAVIGEDDDDASDVDASFHVRESVLRKDESSSEDEDSSEQSGAQASEGTEDDDVEANPVAARRLLSEVAGNVIMTQKRARPAGGYYSKENAKNRQYA
jgi:outer membrane biosynthesis protein TonB